MTRFYVRLFLDKPKDRASVFSKNQINQALRGDAMDFKEMLKEGAEAAREFGKDAKELAEDIVEKAGGAIEKVMSDDEPTYYERAADIYSMMSQGQMLGAFDKYYHDDVVVQEATGEVREGKAVNRTFEEKWLASIQEFHGGGATVITSNEKEKVTMVEAWVDVTFKDGKRMKMEEVAVQQWDGDQIIHERFYYNAPSS